MQQSYEERKSQSQKRPTKSSDVTMKEKNADLTNPEKERKRRYGDAEDSVLPKLKLKDSRRQLSDRFDQNLDQESLNIDTSYGGEIESVNSDKLAQWKQESLA